MAVNVARGWVALVAVGVVVVAIGGCRQPRHTSPVVDIEELRERPLYTFGEPELDRYLGWMHESHPELCERVVAFGRQSIGQPYQIYLLGEFPFEEYDPDPIYCLDRSDCLTFSEHMYAMALGNDWWSFLRNLQRLRYRDGEIGMLTRNHYTVADWNRNNGFLFVDVTADLGEGDLVVPLRQVCRRSRFFSQFGIGMDVADEPVRDVYIPKERLAEVLDGLHDGDFVNIIRGNSESQYCGHTGLIAIADDGTPDFLHSARPAVREQPLLEYVNSDRRCLGVKFLRLRPDAERIMQESAGPPATDVSEAALGKALARRYAAAPDDAKPVRLDWRRASRLQGYRLRYDSVVDAGLQESLEEADRLVCAELGIGDEEHAVGVLDLTDLRLALVRPDAMFYAASVPKICILAAYFANHVDDPQELSPEVERELGLMIKHSDNALAAKYGRVVTLEKLEEFVRDKHYRFYDEEHGGGLWIGKHYTQDSPRVGDPLLDHSHAATVRQCLRYYLILEQGRLISAAASVKMRQIFASPQLEHKPSKFVAGLDGRGVTLIRKSGTWRDWHLDTARIKHGERVYLLVGMAHHPRGAEYLERIAAAVDSLICGE